MLNTCTELYCSEFEFLVYSIIILRAQQMTRYGLENIDGTDCTAFKQFLITMEDCTYPKVYDEYFKRLGTVTTKGGFPINMRLTLEKAIKDEPTLTEETREAYNSQVSVHTINDLGK